MQHYQAQELEEFATRCFVAVSVPFEDARTIARILVLADLRGIDSHGVTRIPIYIERIRRQAVNAQPEVRVVADAGACALIDGDNGPGPVVSWFANGLAMERARRYGAAAVVVRNSNHNGICSAYTLESAGAGMIGIAATNAARSMAIAGSRESLVGTNPLSIAVPCSEGPPLVLDMATSVVARGKVVEHAKRGECIPEGWALDAEGKPTTDAVAAERGVILPMAGAKGSGLAIMIEILCGVLSGGVFGTQIRNMYTEFEQPQGVGHFFLALDPLALGQGELPQRIAALAAMLRSGKKAQGVDEILLPGEPEARQAVLRSGAGIGLPGNVIEDLRAVAVDLGIVPLR